MNLNYDIIDKIQKISNLLANKELEDDFCFEKFVIFNKSNYTLGYGQHGFDQELVFLHPNESKSYSWKFFEKGTENVKKCHSFFLFI